MANLGELFDAHCAAEFEAIDVEATMATMTDSPHVHNVPTNIGGVGYAAVRDFYTNYFVGHVPPDTTAETKSRTLGESSVVDEVLFSFTHTEPIDFMLPGIAPTGRRISIPLVVVVGFEGNQVAYEHIYWDQASVLAQAGLLDPTTLPVSGADQATALWDHTHPRNALLNQAD